MIRIEHAGPAGNSPRIVMFGPQGAGKSTQAIRISTAFGIPVVSTGDLFRAHVAHGTHLGAQVKEFVDSGRLVPDELATLVVRQRIGDRSRGPGFLLDGYPRNIEQARHLDHVLQETGESLDAVIALDVPRAELRSRLRLRDGQMHRRDHMDARVLRRMDTHESETAPLLDIYDKRVILDRVDGVGLADDVTERIFAALVARDLIPTPFRWRNEWPASRRAS